MNPKMQGQNIGFPPPFKGIYVLQWIDNLREIKL